MGKIRVLLVDNHHLFREGLANILNSRPDFEVVGEASDGLEAVVKARQLRPDMILMDVVMPVCDGVEATYRIKQELPDTIVIMLTIRDEDEKLFEAIKSGAQGYLLKSIRSKELCAMLRGAAYGDAAITPDLGGRMLEEFRRLSERVSLIPDEEIVSLTCREREVLALVAQGMSDQEVADRLTISIHTVKSHMRHILNKLQLGKRHEAATYAMQQGLIWPLRDDLDS